MLGAVMGVCQVFKWRFTRYQMKKLAQAVDRRATPASNALIDFPGFVHIMCASLQAGAGWLTGSLLQVCSWG